MLQWEICSISQYTGENNIFFQKEKVILVEAVYNFPHTNVWKCVHPNPTYMSLYLMLTFSLTAFNTLSAA